MTTLFAHIGIPKTGTTSIQDNLKNDDRIHMIETFYFHKASFWGEKDFTFSDEKVNVISNETFAVRGEGGGKLPLRCILQRLTDECRDTRILLTIRNQPSSLSSMFRYRIMMGNSFRCFNDWLTGDEGMDFYAVNQYGTLVRSMLDFVPLENICVLCFEQLVRDPQKFYEGLYNFFGLELQESKVDCNRHSNKSLSESEVYAKNILNRHVGHKHWLNRRIVSASLRFLPSLVKERVPKDFFSLTTVVQYEQIMKELGANNGLLLEHFPDLRPLLEEYGYPLVSVQPPSVREHLRIQ